MREIDRMRGVGLGRLLPGAAHQGRPQGALVLNAVVLAEIAPRFSRIEALREALPSMTLIDEIPLRSA